MQKRSEAQPAVRALIAVAATAPRIPVYDDYLRRFGGDPDAALHAKNRPRARCGGELAYISGQLTSTAPPHRMTRLES